MAVRYSSRGNSFNAGLKKTQSLDFGKNGANAIEDQNEANMTKEKQIAFTAIEQQMTELHSIGADIWRYKELPGMEERSHRRITHFLNKKGFNVQEHYLGFRNAFRAEFGEGEVGGANPHPNICFLCQYDADVRGHVRGHNLVVVNALTAALGLQTLIKFSNEPIGRVTVIGCPSNHDKTLKSAMFEQNCFRQIDFILMAYPAHYTTMTPKFVAGKTYAVLYKGRNREAEQRPYETANPVNACVLAYQNLGVARAHFRPNWTAKAVILSAGTAADVTPVNATMELMLRAPHPDEMEMLDGKVLKCFDAAATATGCTVSVKPMKKEFCCNITIPALRDLYIQNAALSGFTFYNMSEELEEPDDISLLSTSIPVLKVIYYHGDSAKLGSDDFNRYVGKKDCEYAQTVQGKTLAFVGVDLMTSEDTMKAVFEQHQRELGKLYGGIRPSLQDVEK